MSTEVNIDENREFNRTLYFDFLRIFIISVVISIGVYFAYSYITDFIIDNNYLNNEIVIREELNQIFIDLDSKNLDFNVDETIDYINSESRKYEIINYNFSETDIIYTVGNDFNEDIYALYKVIDGRDVVLLISDVHINTIRYFYRLVGLILALSFFLTILKRLSNKYMFYLRDINNSVRKIACGEYNETIKIEGRNELSHLAYSINMMAFDIKKEKIAKEEVEKKQRQLITNVSHDLKTPLTAIIGYLDIVLTLLDNKVDSSILAYLERALVKSKQQQQLITKLFEYSKVVNNDVKINSRELDLNLFTRQYIELVSNEVRLINFNKKHMINADPDLLQRVFDNIFSNIDKYGIKGEKIIISLNELNDNIHLTIENKTKVDLSGKTDKMFERTYVEEKSRTSQSSGLGLSIVKEILSLMNVSIYAEFNKPYLGMVLVFKKLKI